MKRKLYGPGFIFERGDAYLMGLFAVLYIANRNPYLGWNDALSFMAEAVSGWSLDTNATSHFLYTNVLHILVSVFGFLGPVFVATMFSVLCGLVVIVQVQALAALCVPFAWARRFAGMVFGLGFSFWQQSEGVEVYAFNCMLFGAFFLYAMRDFLDGRRDRWIVVSVLLGLMLLTHIQAVLALPFFLYYLLSNSRLTWLIRVSALGIVGAMASVLFILPALLDTHAVSAVFFEARFKEDVLGVSLEVVLMGLTKGLAYFLYNFHLFSIPLLWGWRELFRNPERRPLIRPLLLLLLPFLAFAIKYSVNDNHVFYLLPYMVLIVPIGYGFLAIAEKFRALKTNALLFCMMLPVLLYGTVTWAGRIPEKGKAYDAAKAYKGGLTHLLWPGKAWAKDPLALAREIHRENPGAFVRGEIEWNYPGAIRYLDALDAL